MSGIAVFVCMIVSSMAIYAVGSALGARRAFARAYGVLPPKGSVCVRNPSIRGWIYERGANMRASHVVVDGFAIASRDHAAMEDLASALHDAMYPMTPPASAAPDSEGLYAMFADDPHGFEEWVADLYRSLGWEATVTRASGDGGVDVRLYRYGRTAIVECKCWSPSSNVGRPTLQKLVGANAVERADETVFVTTAGFTAQAREYARQAGVTLIDGCMIAQMVRI